MGGKERETMLKKFIGAILICTPVYASTAQVPGIMQVCDVDTIKFDSTYISTNIPTKNNNPGNIKKSNHLYLGEIDESKTYETFIDVNWGFAAMFSLLHRKYDEMTIYDAINIYAPDFENDTNAYVKFIESQTSFNANEVQINVLDEATIIPIVYAMAKYEGGKNWKFADIMFGYKRFNECVLNK